MNHQKKKKKLTGHRGDMSAHAPCVSFHSGMLDCLVQVIFQFCDAYKIYIYPGFPRHWHQHCWSVINYFILPGIVNFHSSFVNMSFITEYMEIRLIKHCIFWKEMDTVC